MFYNILDQKRIKALPRLKVFKKDNDVDFKEVEKFLEKEVKNL